MDEWMMLASFFSILSVLLFLFFFLVVFFFTLVSITTHDATYCGVGGLTD
jgi:hypothetical protein